MASSSRTPCACRGSQYGRWPAYTCQNGRTGPTRWICGHGSPDSGVDAAGMGRYEPAKFVSCNAALAGHPRAPPEKHVTGTTCDPGKPGIAARCAGSATTIGRGGAGPMPVADDGCRACDAYAPIGRLVDRRARRTSAIALASDLRFRLPAYADWLTVIGPHPPCP
jgi:hypothetical protein